MDTWLLSPPFIFIIVFSLAGAALAVFLHTARRKHGEVCASQEPYACGEDIHSHLVQPDYSTFFPFAFYFTILHVVALFISTVPAETTASFSIAVIYILGAMIGMFILLEK